MKNNEKKRRKISLNFKLVAITVAAILIGTIFYLETDRITNEIIDEVFFSEEAIAKREAKRMDSFKQFASESKIKSTDTSLLKNWAVDQGYIYLTILKNGQTIFDSGFWNESASSYDYDETLQSDEEITYNNAHKVQLADGKFDVTITDYSETPVYYISNIVLFSLSALIVLAFIIFYIKRTTRRIIQLSGEVEKIKKDDINSGITIKSNDELTTLSRDIDEMRNTIIEQMTAQREAVKANGDLVTTMAHDLRTPLTVLTGYIDLVREGRYSDPDEMNRYIGICAEKADEIKELSDKLFQYFFVFSSSDKDYKIEAYDAGELLLQLINENAIILFEKGYKIKSEPVVCNSLIKTDVKYLKRVFDNVFSNVAKYADREKEVLVKTETADDSITVTFINSISPARNSAESTCIGLKSCQKIADALGMEFTAAEQDGIYTTSVKIPLTAKPQQEI